MMYAWLLQKEELGYLLNQKTGSPIFLKKFTRQFSSPLFYFFYQIEIYWRFSGFGKVFWSC